MYGYKWRPSKTKAREFAKTMDEIEQFCLDNDISRSSASDSYYFYIGGRHYRVSNHTTAASYRNSLGRYHTNDDPDMICITAGKTRIRQIYEDLLAGYDLDKRGNRKS